MPVPVRFTFSKGERLCSRTIIGRLFSRKDVFSHFQYPLLAVWLFGPLPSTFPAQVLFSVSKKNFKKAHDRNRIRRQLREAYRLQKTFLYEALLGFEVQCALILIYIPKEEITYEQITKSLPSVFKKIHESVAENTKHTAH